jgi:hypothetical protein
MQKNKQTETKTHLASTGVKKRAESQHPNLKEKLKYRYGFFPVFLPEGHWKIGFRNTNSIDRRVHFLQEKKNGRNLISKNYHGIVCGGEVT